MKNSILFLLLVLPFISTAQKVKYNKKTNEVTVDESVVFNMESTGCGILYDDCHYDVFDTAGTKIIRVNFREFNSLAEKSKANPDGRIVYFEFIFMKSKIKAEIELGGFKDEVAKMIVKNDLIKNGVLNEKAVDEFVLVHGTEFSERMKGEREKTIIIRN